MTGVKRWKRYEGRARPGNRERRRRRALGLPVGSLLTKGLVLTAILMLAGVAAWYVLGRGGYRSAVLGIVAGPGAPSYQASIGDVGRPLAVATSPDGRLVYVGESDGQRAVRIFDRQEREAGIIEAPDPAQGWLPLDIAVARTGEVYVVDGAVGAIYEFSPEGEFVRKLPPPEGLDVWSPSALAFDDVGNMYVTERFESASEDRHRVLVFSPEGELIRQFGSKGNDLGELNYPSAIAIDDQGRVYVNNMNTRIDVFTSEGRHVTRFGAGEGEQGVGLARGLALDREGRLYAVDVTGQRVAVYDTKSEGFPFLYAFGSFGLEGGKFRFPASVAVDVSGRVYVADRENYRVQIWS